MRRRGRVPNSIRLVGAVLRVPELRRVELAFAAFGLGEYASWVAILVYAYGIDGATGAGIAAVVQLAPSAVAAPLAASLGDLLGLRLALIGGYAAQAVTMGGVAAALFAHAPYPAVLALAALAAVSLTFTRPAQWSILPSLAETPEQLTAANVVTASVGNATVLVGPVLAGIFLGVSGPGLVFAVAAGGLVVSTALVAHVPTAPRSPLAMDVGDLVRESKVGLVRLMEEPRSRLVVLLMALRSIGVGALDVLAVVLALGFLHIGRSGAGYLTGAFGGGALIGGAASLALVGNATLSRPLRFGLLVFGLPVAAIAALRAPWIAFVLLALGGAGHAVAEVAGRTLLQRLTPENVLSRVFGVLEGLDMAGLAIGSILVSVLVAAVGIRWTLLALGVLLPVVVVLTGRGLHEADLGAEVDLERLRLLRRIAMFRPLDPPTLERLAKALIPFDAEPGTTVIREGDPGDRVYLIAEGTVEVIRNGERITTLGADDLFGEIALLRDVPRTATVRCIDRCRLYALEREPFLAAVTRHPTAAAHADAVVRSRAPMTH